MAKSSGDAGGGECKGFLLPALWKSMKSHVERNGEAFAYYSAWRTSAQMLEDRNIWEIDTNSFDINYAQFLSKFNLAGSDKPRQPDIDALAIAANHKFKAAEKVAVAFRETGEMDDETMRAIHTSLGKPSRIVVVLHGEPAYYQQFRFFSSRPENPIQIEFFHIAELFVNVLRDTWKTEFKMATTEEQEHVFKEHVKVAKLPRIDWIARYFALQEGEIVKGTYTSPPDALEDVWIVKGKLPRIDWIARYFALSCANELLCCLMSGGMIARRVHTVPSTTWVMWVITGLHERFFLIGSV